MSGTTYALVIAGKGGRRSLVAREVADALAARGVRVGGFAQRTTEPEPGVKTIELVRIGDGRSAPLARTSKGSADPSACSLAFDRGAFEVARRWIEEDAAACEVLVVDGLGKLELGGDGHRAAIGRALAAGPLVVLAVRDDQLVYALEALGLDEPVAAYTDGEGAAALHAFAEQVARAAQAAGRAAS
jgi:nucleoside-triphosphatase THEP1